MTISRKMIVAVLLVASLFVSGCDWTLISLFTPEDKIDVQVQFNSYVIDRESNQPLMDEPQLLIAKKLKGKRLTGNVVEQTVLSDVNGKSTIRFGYNLHPGEYITMCYANDVWDEQCEVITFADAEARGQDSVSMVKELRALV